MKQVILIYDDHQMPDKEIKAITGEKSYGETIFKRVTLKNRIFDVVKNQKTVPALLEIPTTADAFEISDKLSDYADNTTVIHLYSNYAIANTEDFLSLIKKAEFMNDAYCASCEGEAAMLFLPSISSYKEALSTILRRDYSAQQIANEAFVDLSKRSNFLNFITGGFDARFFNALAGDEYTVTKRSTKIDKIRAEYEFYYLLPDHMKMWFVMPYDYKEDAEGSSYTMERFHMTDIAIRFVHGAVDTKELHDILQKLFYFINLRTKKAVAVQTGQEIAKELYVDKLLSRMEELKAYKEYKQFDEMIQMGTEFDGIDAVVAKYRKLYDAMSDNRHYDTLSIGHGDLCFSNILYGKESGLLKLIDPKGATKEDDLYTDPYYDLAKLSHSICGCYDFFNSGLYEIAIDRDLKLKLTIDGDSAPYVKVFREFLSENGFDYARVRLYEASLFLSMLPYHMDQPGKVFGFLLNAIQILDEVEKCTKI